MTDRKGLYLGGSDVARVIRGEGRDLVLEKLGLKERQTQTDIMWLGTHLEPVGRAMFAKSRNKTIYTDPQSFDLLGISKDDIRTWNKGGVTQTAVKVPGFESIYATIDGWFYNNNGNPQILELKWHTDAVFMKCKLADYELPDYTMAQVQTYALLPYFEGVTVVDYSVEWASHGLDQGIVETQVKSTEDWRDAIRIIDQKFTHYMQTGELPPMENEITAPEIARIPPETIEKVFQRPPASLFKGAMMYTDIKARLEEHKKNADRLKDSIKSLMMGYTQADMQQVVTTEYEGFQETTPRRFIIELKPTKTSEKFDDKQALAYFKAKFPDEPIWDNAKKTVESKRTLKIKEVAPNE